MIENKNKIKIIIDTDNGDDIDDLITLYFALANQDKFDIIGIICSYLNAPLRVNQVKHTLKLFNREDIPVYCGVSKPLGTLHPQPLDTVYCQYTPELGDATDFDEERGINFLIDSARKYKDDLIILEIAPQPTLGRAIQKDKEAFKDTPIVLMAGAFYKDVNEWNIECDYESANIVLNSGLNLTYVGLDVTDLTELTNPYYENHLLAEYKTPRLAYLSKCSNMWVNYLHRHIVLHDPLTLLTLIDDKLCEFEYRHVQIIPNEDKTRYYTRITDNENDPYIKVAKSLDLTRLLENHFIPLFKEVDKQYE